MIPCQRLLQILCMALFLCAFANLSSATEDCAYKGTATSTPLASELHRGVNLSGWWGDDRHNSFLEWDFQNIHDMGFDFVRIPVTPKWLEIKDKQIQAETLATLRCNIISVLNHHLAVVFDLHPGKDAQDAMNAMSQDELLAYLQDIWKNAAPLFKGIPANRVALQLLNEPDPKLSLYWWNVQGKLVAALRTIYPHQLIIVSSIENGPWNYVSVAPYADKNLLYDFHFYQPMFFTHHAAEWVNTYTPAEKNENVPYPITRTSIPPGASNAMKEYVAKGWNKDALAAQMASAIRWAARYGIKLTCLEFGVYRPHVSTESRARWLHDMRDILESHHIPWAVWEYDEGFGIRETDRQKDTAIRAALGLESHSTHPSHATH